MLQATLLSLLSLGCASHAHTTPHPAPVAAVEVSVAWVWVAPHLRHGVGVRGHWYHPHYGKSYRQKHAGPPPQSPRHGAHWVPGHWEGRGHKRHWVPGHWR